MEIIINPIRLYIKFSSNMDMTRISHTPLSKELSCTAAIEETIIKLIGDPGWKYNQYRQEIAVLLSQIRKNSA